MNEQQRHARKAAAELLTFITEGDDIQATILEHLERISEQHQIDAYQLLIAIA